jgi:drug/metabolite transporter (DMT)-like permease
MISRVMPVRFQSLYSNAYLLLGVTMLFWAGNAIAARSAVGHISPMVMTAGRWAIASIFVWVFLRGEILKAWPEMKARWKFIFLMGTFGYSVFSLLLYLGGHYTTAVNIALIQGAIPIFTLVGAYFIYATPVFAVQAVGIVLTLIGVAVTVSGGDLATLAALTLNAGDILIITASALYAGYTLALKKRPAISGLAFYAGAAAGAAISSIPMLGAEIWLGKAVWPDETGWWILIFVSIAPSFLAQIFYMRAIDLIGPGRAVLFANLTPVLGAFLAVLLLGEPFGWHHAISMALVLGGIAIAEKGRK